MAHGLQSKHIEVENHRHSRWLILDGKTLAWSHGRDQRYSYEGIILAVECLRDMGHGNIIVCVPEWMTQHEDVHHLDVLQDKVLWFTTPSCPDLIEASEISFMDALAKTIDALIVTQTGPDTWSEPCNLRILQFTMTSDSFMLPRDPRGKHGPTLQDMLQSVRVPNEYEVKGEIFKLKNKWKKYCRILRGPQNSSPVKKHPQTLIIDGSNVAMAHGLQTFYSVRGIELAVKYFKNEGHCVNAYVPIWRKNSGNTVCEHTLLQLLYKDDLVTYTASMAYDDLLMLEEAKNKNGFIVSNYQFRDAPPEYKDTIQRCVRFRFQGNHFQVPPNSCQALDYSDTDTPVVYEHEEWPMHTHSTKAVDNDDTDATIVYDQAAWSMATPSTEIHQHHHPQIPPTSGKVYNYGTAIVQDPEKLTLAKAKPMQELHPATTGDSRAEQHHTSSQDCGGLWKKPTSTCLQGLSKMSEKPSQQAQLNRLRGSDNSGTNSGLTSSPQLTHVWPNRNQQRWKQQNNKFTSTGVGGLPTAEPTSKRADQQTHHNTFTGSVNSGTKNDRNSRSISSNQHAHGLRQQRNQHRRKQWTKDHKSTRSCSLSTEEPTAKPTTSETVDQQAHLNTSTWSSNSGTNSGTNNGRNDGLTSSPQETKEVRPQRNQQRRKRNGNNKFTSTESQGLPAADPTSKRADQQTHLHAIKGSVHSGVRGRTNNDGNSGPTSSNPQTHALYQQRNQQRNQQLQKQRTNKLTSTSSFALSTAKSTGKLTSETVDQQAHFNTSTQSGNRITNSATNHVENSIQRSSSQHAQQVCQQQNQRRKERTIKPASTCSRAPSTAQPTPEPTTMETVNQQTHLNLFKESGHRGTNNVRNSKPTSSPQHAQRVCQQQIQHQNQQVHQQVDQQAQINMLMGSFNRGTNNRTNTGMNNVRNSKPTRSGGSSTADPAMSEIANRQQTNKHTSTHSRGPAAEPTPE